jgi:CubicO group peptidase (beta-lactamase class C family)
VKLAEVNRRLGKVERAIEKAIEAGELPGAVVMARMGESLACTRVCGAATLVPERIEARENTIYDLASITKVMATTASVMLLVADGRIELDAPVATYLPAFAERGKGKISVRHLLTHSSGLRPWRAYHADLAERDRRRGESVVGSAAGKAEITNRVLRSAPVHEPGEASVYGDLDFIALGALVEAVAGEELDVFCARRIFQPLGLVDTRFNRLPYRGERARYAATEQCSWRERVLWGEVHDPNAWAMGGVAGHAGLFSTAGEVLRFGQEMLAADRGESAIFPAEVAREFFRRQEIAPQPSGHRPGGPMAGDWALGWDTPTPGQSTSGAHFSKRSIGHTGFTGTSLWIDLERGMIVVFLSNRIHLVAKRSRFELRPLVHDLIWEAFLAA